MSQTPEDNSFYPFLLKAIVDELIITKYFSIRHKGSDLNQGPHSRIVVKGPTQTEFTFLFNNYSEPPRQELIIHGSPATEFYVTLSLSNPETTPTKVAELIKAVVIRTVARRVMAQYHSQSPLADLIKSAQEAKFTKVRNKRNSQATLTKIIKKWKTQASENT